MKLTPFHFCLCLHLHSPSDMTGPVLSNTASAQCLKGKSRHKSIALNQTSQPLHSTHPLEKGDGASQLTGVLHSFDLACPLPCLLLLCLTGHQLSNCHFNFCLCPPTPGLSAEQSPRTSLAGPTCQKRALQQSCPGEQEM